MVIQNLYENILGYELQQDIGEGGQARVRLGYNSKTRQFAAIKILAKQNQGQIINRAAAEKEIRIHSSVSHFNIIKLFNYAEDDHALYLVLEYAQAGELFDRIEPDRGIGEDIAHFYLTQLVHALGYLHGRGISHRDLKPENMLLDESGNLKLTDFGLATVFKYQGQTRVLTTPCGSPPYVAPEIHSLQYQGDMVDIWACGIILFVLLAGNTPWAEPTSHDDEFKEFVRKYPYNLDFGAWSKFSPSVLELLIGILNIHPKRRFRLQDIQSNAWFMLQNDLLTDGRCNNPEKLAERFITHATTDDLEDIGTSYSQPTDLRLNGTCIDESPMNISFSQPTQHFHESPSNEMRPGPFMDSFPSTFNTRFYSSETPERIMKVLGDTLDQFVVPNNRSNQRISFTTVDKRKCQLSGEIIIQKASVNIVCFRKRKGDPLEFKRFYKAVVESIKDIII